MYMVQRRERLKKQLLLVQSERLQLEAGLLQGSDMLEEGFSGGTRGSIPAFAASSGSELLKGRKRSCSHSHRSSSSDTDEEVTVRKTR